MRTYLDCLPCFVAQALSAGRVVAVDEKTQMQILQFVLPLLARTDLRMPPPTMGQKIHQLVRQLTKNSNPYHPIKVGSNRRSLDAYPHFKAAVDNAADPLKTAVGYAIAANTFDYCANASSSGPEFVRVIENSLPAEIDISEIEEFRAALKDAERILYIGDQAGEIVFDRLLIEQMPVEKVTFVVKGGPVGNKATIADARMVGLTDIVEVTDDGYDAPGTMPASSSWDFRERFDAADLIVAKGHENYESLNGVSKDIFFLMHIRCSRLADASECREGTSVLLRSGRLGRRVMKTEIPEIDQEWWTKIHAEGVMDGSRWL